MVWRKSWAEGLENGDQGAGTHVGMHIRHNRAVFKRPHSEGGGNSLFFAGKLGDRHCPILLTCKNGRSYTKRVIGESLRLCRRLH